MSARGNALFLILIAVALFAALSYAVTQSGRGSGSLTRENTALEIARIENFASQVQSAITRMKVIGNIPEYLISYEDTFSNSTANASCTTTDCKLFEQGGGGVPKGFSLGAAYQGAAAYAGKFWFRNVTLAGMGDDNTRDFFLLFPNASLALCMAFNTHVGVTNTSGAPPVDDHGGAAGEADYSGNISSQVTLADVPRYGESGGSPITGKAAFCVNDSGAYHIYMLLIAR